MTQQEFQYHPFDLCSTFVEAMHCTQWFGRTPFGQSSSLEFIVCRSRYLLSIAQDSHIHDLLFLNSIEEERAVLGIEGHGMETIGVWMIGLLKHEGFKHEIGHWISKARCVPDEAWLSVNSQATVFHVAALLMEQPDYAATVLRQQIDRINANRELKEAQRHWLLATAVAALEWQDEQFGRQDAISFCYLVDTSKKEYARHRLQRLLDASYLLRAGLRFGGPEHLQAQLRRFIRSATPIEFQIAGALQEPVLRPFLRYDAPGENRRYQAQLQEFKQVHAIYDRLGLSPPAYRAQEFRKRAGQYFVFQGRTKPARDTFLFQRLQAWLAGTEPDPFWLRIGVGGANNAFDIVASLELDIHLRLPVELVDVLYQKLMTLVGFDASLYRQYAYDLLLRSSSMDAKAAELLAMADSIAASQYPVEHYPLLKMSRQSQSASAKAETPLT